MKLLKDINIKSFLRVLCLVFCAIVLLSACSSEENAKMGKGDNVRQAAYAQYAMCVSDESKKMDLASTWQPDIYGECKYDDTDFFVTGIQGAIVSTICSGIGDMAVDVYNKVTTEDLLALMMVAFSLWMAFQILQHVSATSPESIGEFWTKVLRKGTLCFACGYLASSPENILYVVNTFVFPVYITFLELTLSVMDAFEPIRKTSAFLAVVDGEDSFVPATWDISYDPEEFNLQIADLKMTTSHFPTGPRDIMAVLANGVADRLNGGYALALKGILGEGLFGFMVSIFLMAAFTIAKWGFIMYLVDSFFRMVMMIIVMPFLILFYAFEQTRKWTNMGFKIILNSSAILLCLTIVVSMCCFGISDLVSSSNQDFNNVKQYQNFGTVPLAMMMIGFVVLKATSLSITLADSLVGGGGDNNFQRKVAALVGTVSQYVFAGLTAGFGKIATAAANHSARLRAMNEKVQKAKAVVSKAANFANRIAGRK